MQFFTTLATLFVLVSASTASTIVTRQGPPSCAGPCLQTTNTFGCASTDDACLCRNQQFIATQEACINAACTNPSDLAQADTFAKQLCLFVGVTLSSASPSSTANTASAASTASTASTAPTASSSGTASASSTPQATSNSATVIASSGSFALVAGVAAVAFVL